MLEVIKNIVIEELSLDASQNIEPNANLIQFGLDSIRLFRLVDKLEKNFNVQIDNIEITQANFENLNLIKELIERHQKA